jgi:hypothetical protein
MSFIKQAKAKAIEFLSVYYTEYTEDVDMFIGTFWNINPITKHYAIVFHITGSNYTSYKIVPVSMYKRYTRYSKLIELNRKYDHATIKRVAQYHVTLIERLKRDIAEWDNVK